MEMNKYDIKKLRRINNNITEEMNSVLTENPLGKTQQQKQAICSLLEWALNYISETENMTIDEVLSTNCGEDLRMFDPNGNIREEWA